MKKILMHIIESTVDPGPTTWQLNETFLKALLIATIGLMLSRVKLQIQDKAVPLNPLHVEYAGRTTTPLGNWYKWYRLLKHKSTKVLRHLPTCFEQQHTIKRYICKNRGPPTGLEWFTPTNKWDTLDGDLVAEWALFGNQLLQQRRPCLFLVARRLQSARR